MEGSLQTYLVRNVDLLLDINVEGVDIVSSIVDPLDDPIALTVEASEAP